MATVTIEDVGDTLNVGDSDIPDAKVLKTIKAAKIGLVYPEEFRKNAVKLGGNSGRLQVLKQLLNPLK